MYIVFIYLYDRPSLIGIVQVLAKFNHFPLGFFALFSNSPTFFISPSFYIFIYIFVLHIPTYNKN